ncbi:hypothetical protein FQA39_LY18917, partial [Lamprigera yunnana]
MNPEVRQKLILGWPALDGQTVGIVANQPLVLAGLLISEQHPRPRALLAVCDAVQHPR